LLKHLLRFAKLIEFLTLKRARVYALLTSIIAASVVLSFAIESPQRLTGATDFPAFYNAGKILNEHSSQHLYDRDLQRQLYVNLAPDAASRRNLYFAYSPFFALIFSPFAMLPYTAAFVCWTLVSLTLFTVGFFLVWKAEALPPRDRTDAFLVAVAFLPFFTWCLTTGQTSAFGFFWLALAIYFDRKVRPFQSGCALAILLYKPTLLVLILPMLVITKRWRTILGFSVAALGLGLISLLLIGANGIVPYVRMLEAFSEDKASGRHPNWADIDIFSFFLPLVGGHSTAARLLTLIVAMIVVPFLYLVWRRRPEVGWATAIIWTLVLNFYVLIYDVTFIVLAVLLTAAFYIANRHRLPLGLRWFMLVLFLVPWIETNLALRYGFHPMTLVIVGFGCYQLYQVSNNVALTNAST